MLSIALYVDIWFICRHKVHIAPDMDLSCTILFHKSTYGLYTVQYDCISRHNLTRHENGTNKSP